MLFAVPALGLPSVALATTFVNRPLGEIVKETPNIVHGRAGDSYSDWDKSGRKTIYTYTWFNVTEVLRGDVPDPRILLRQPGGEKDGMEMSVPGTAGFTPGEDVVVLLGDRNKEDDSYDVPGFTTGKYNVVAGENGEPALVNSLGGAAMYDPKRDPRTMSYNSKIPLEVFRRIARGEDIPESSHHQFEGSRGSAPNGAFEAGHRPLPTPNSRPAVAPSPRPAASAEPAIREDSHAPGRWPRGFWIPLSFSALALAGGLALWASVRRRQ